MKYTTKDLDYAFIRAKRGIKWQNVALSKITSLEFKNWVARRLTICEYTPNEIELPYTLTKQDRADALTRLDQLGIPTAMIKRGAREEFNEATGDALI